ncbi:MAG: N-acetylneuraminate synthase family protein [Pseudomonadota bacterium]
MGQGVCIIAEVGSVHDGSLGNAGRLIDAAAACGADAVKFQTHIAAAETIKSAPMPNFFTGEPRFEYFERTGFGLEQWCELKSRCDQRGVEFLSSPFSIQAVELLEAVGVARYKVPSGEVTNQPLLEALAQTGKPLILSSGMSTWEELDRAVETIRRHHDQLVVLQCTSEYPCPHERVGLNVMLEMRARYGLEVGLSDHTLSTYASLAAVTLGARVIERHFAFSRLMYGSDAPHSLEPEELADLVRGVRAIECMLAHPVQKADASRFSEMKRVFEKSLVALVDIPAGAVLTPSLLGVKKPGDGIPAARLGQALGRRATRAIAADSLLREEDIAWD